MSWFRKFLCNVMGWHSPGGENQTFDGCNWDAAAGGFAVTVKATGTRFKEVSQ